MQRRSRRQPLHRPASGDASTHAPPYPINEPWQSALRAGCIALRTRAYLIGGALRDALLGYEPDDLDVATATDPFLFGEALAQATGGAFVPMDKERRIARVVVAGWAPPHVDLVPMPAQIEQHCAGRDFTVNALALPLNGASAEWTEALVDPCNGRADLQARVLRAIHDGIFRDDPVRLLRAIRLAAERGLTIEPVTLALLQRDAVLLTDALRDSPERVRDELARLLRLEDSALWLERLDTWGLLTRAFPELEAGRGVDQPFIHVWDVLTHQLKAVGALEALLRGELAGAAEVLRPEWRPAFERYLREELVKGRERLAALKLATLLHDVGKPATKALEPSGRARFFGHDDLGAELAAAAMERLRFSKRETEMVRLLVQEHLRPAQLSTGAALPTDRALYRFFRDTAGEGLGLLLLHLADAWATRGPATTPEAWAATVRRVVYVLERHLQAPAVAAPPKLISGHDLMSRFGLSPGPLIGRLLEAVREAQAAGEVTTKEEALEYARRLLQQEAAETGGPSDA